MKVGVCINQAWNVFNFRKGLVVALQAKGHEVVAFVPPDSVYVPKIESMGCTVCHVEMEQKGANPLADLQLIFALKQAYTAHAIDAVMHFTIKPNIYGAIAAKWAGIPSINSVTGLGTVFIRQNLTAKIAHALYRLSFRFPHRVFFQNADDLQLFLDMGLVKASIAELTPGSGVNLLHFQPQRPKQDGNFRFLMIARMIFDKGILEYIEAARLLKAKGLPFTCQLLGKVEADAGLGVQKHEVEAWERQGLIQYLGTTDDVRPVIAEADCVVLPSYREGTPRTLLEAAAMGKPLIATDVPGCRETVKDGYNGWLCQAKSSHSLAEKMEAMLALDKNALSVFGKNSRQLAEGTFDENIVVQKYLDALKSATE